MVLLCDLALTICNTTRTVTHSQAWGRDTHIVHIRVCACMFTLSFKVQRLISSQSVKSLFARQSQVILPKPELETFNSISFIKVVEKIYYLLSHAHTSAQPTWTDKTPKILLEWDICQTRTILLTYNLTLETKKCFLCPKLPPLLKHPSEINILLSP